MSFLPVRFPIPISLGARGGPGWETIVNEVDSGFENREQRLSQPRGLWIVSRRVMKRALWEQMQDLWMVAKGRANGFLFRDPFDFEVTAARSALVVIDGTHAQLAKRYTYQGQTFDRHIRKVVLGSDSFTGGSGLSLDNTTGILTHSGLPSSFACLYDNAVRFDMDDSPQELANKKPGDQNYLVDWSGIQLRGIRT